MILAAGTAILLTAVALFGAAVLLPSAPDVPLDRRRPFDPEPPSSLTRLALSAVRSFERLLAGRNIPLFARPELENAGLRLSQAEFFLLVGIGAGVGMLVGTVAVGPLVGLLLALLAPMAGEEPVVPSSSMILVLPLAFLTNHSAMRLPSSTKSEPMKVT